MIGAGLFLAAYVASGFAGLVYEVSWTRLLTLYLGHTTAAASTVVAAFMGGLAGGAALGGRVAARLSPRQALKAYLVLELVVIAAALSLPLALRALTPLLRWAYADGAPGAFFPLFRLAVCLALLVVPSLALGATFPMAVRWFVGQAAAAGRLAGALYAANTAGAALGALLAGLVLLPALGLFRTVLVGVGASALAVAAVVLVARADGQEPDRRPPARTAQPGRKPASGGKPGRKRPDLEPPGSRPDQWGLAAAVLGLTGFATLAFEVTWMRVFALTSGPSIYAFAGTVAAVIAGLAIGSALGSGLAGRTTRPALALAMVLLITAGVAIYAAAFAGASLPRTIAERLAASAPDGGGIGWLRVWLMVRLVLPTAIGLGVAFPLALQLAAGGGADAATAPRLGAVYAVNATCSVLGSLATGFLILPRLGLQHTLTFATASLVLAVLLLAFVGALRRPARAALATLAVAVAIGLAMQAPWDRELLASGVYKYASRVQKDLDLETALTAGTLLYYRDGAAATVSVKRLTGELSLSVDGKVDASTSVDMLTQKALAHLPLLLHPNPQTVAIIGLGSGVTLASALLHPVSSVDVVEIAPEVVEASEFFADENRHALDDPRTHLILGDGRSHLQLATRQYDVIVSEPSNPWMAGIAALFTQEFLLSVRERLSPGGVLCQWAHTYDISDADLRSIVATFASVFPDGTLWLMGDGDLLLVGSAGGSLHLEDLAARWRRPGVGDDLLTVGASGPFAFLSSYVGGAEEMRRYADGVPVQTDDRMALEFSAPRALYAGKAAANVAVLRGLLDGREAPAVIAEAWASAGALDRRHRADMLSKANAWDAAYREYAAALALDPTDAEAALGLVRTAAAAHTEPSAMAALDAAIRSHPEATAARIARSKMLAATGAFAAAIDAAKETVALRPADATALEHLASLYADVGDPGGLATAVAALRLSSPAGRATAYYQAAADFLRGDLPAAEQSVRRAITIDPAYAPARNLLGAILANLGRTDEARAAFAAALRADPQDPTTYANQGRLELSTGHPDVAAGLFAEALSLDPSSEAARSGLTEATGR